MLKLYALYKIATKNQENPSGDKPLINAFKANALFQAKHMNIETAMLEYISYCRERGVLTVKPTGTLT
jgi:diazepam-binding inhibitor (GABA receptor modulating acyl-CoA-binding protein)